MFTGHVEQFSEHLAGKLLLLDGRNKSVEKTVFAKLSKQGCHSVHGREGAGGYFDNFTFHPDAVVYIEDGGRVQAENR